MQAAKPERRESNDLTQPTAVPDKAHASLGASVASRWMNCPGSVRLSSNIPPAPSTSYAQEGTAAHALAELALTKNADPMMWIGLELEGVEVTEDMADFVRVYVEHCRKHMVESSNHWIEKRFNLAALNPPAPMFGTADFVAYNAETRELIVVDLKYGQGVVVEAKNNPQLRYYALGAALSLDPAEFPVESIVVTIVQPRAAHPDGPIRQEELTYIELIEFAADLMEKARATTTPDAPLSAGSHCRFCPASAMCPEQRRDALAVAQAEFSVIETEEFTPPAPETIHPDQFAFMLNRLHVLEDWASSMRALAQARLEKGEHVPGFKLVEKRATRKWTDEEEVEQMLVAAKFEPDEYVVKKLKSPAQVEKLYRGKKKFEAALGGLVEKYSSGYTMVTDSDPRPAVALSAGSDFAALPSGSSDRVNRQHDENETE